MNKITVKATKLKVNDRFKAAGISYKITNLSQNFGRKKTKSNARFYDLVTIHAVTCGSAAHDHQSFRFPGDTKLTIRRK